MSSRMKISPKKRFGQHFLKDTGVLDRMIQLVRPDPQDLFVEIGAGEGALTIRIAPRVYRLLAVEVDRDRIAHLCELLARFPQALVIQGDVLTLDLPELIAPQLESGSRLRVIGNLPFNIGTAIIERLLQMDLPIADILVMVQLEVGERIVALPGSKQYGYLSVVCQRLAETRIHFRVAPGCFVPRPKVWSAVVSLRPKPASPGLTPLDSFLEIVRASFAHRRKTLANSLRLYPEIDGVAEDLLAGAGIRGNRRAEELSLDEYEALAAQFTKFRCTG